MELDTGEKYKLMWSKYVTRRLAVQVAQAWNFGWGQAMKRVYGVSVTDTLVFRDDKKTDYYVNSSQHQKYVASLYQMLNKENFLKVFHKQAQAKLETILKETTTKFNQDFSKLSNKHLLAVYQNFILPNQTRFYIRMWTVFNIGEPLAEVVKQELSKRIAEPDKVIEYLLELSSPLKPNDVLTERMELLQLALIKHRITRQQFQKRLARHTAKYAHIPMFDFDHDPYTEKHFSRQLRQIKRPEGELKEINRLFVNRKKHFRQMLKKLKADRKLGLLLKFLKENVFLRDYRDMIRQKLNLQLRKFYQEIGRRLGLTLAEVASLTNHEISKYLKAEKKFPKSIVQQRNKAYLLIQSGNRAKIYSGQQALDKAKLELQEKRLQKTREIRGIVGSGGFAKGRAKIVYTNKDLKKVQKGDIIVAAMTRQDFVTAIRKAKALVTDEGSVTAHAAIIARELKMPCIVATKIATKIFKDGDMVEVDAERGVVRKI